MSDVPERLDPEEERDVRADLLDLQRMRAAFTPTGIKGVVIACPDCGEDHYYEWELLRENLEHLLATGEQRMHEPAFRVDEDEYVDWEYGRGYVDALDDLGMATPRAIAVDPCPWCASPTGDDAAFCARCGRSLAPARLFAELIARGIPDAEARTMLLRVGFEPFPD